MWFETIGARISDVDQLGVAAVEFGGKLGVHVLVWVQGLVEAAEGIAKLHHAASIGQTLDSFLTLGDLLLVSEILDLPKRRQVPRLRRHVVNVLR